MISCGISSSPNGGTASEKTKIEVAKIKHDKNLLFGNIFRVTDLTELKFYEQKRPPRQVKALTQFAARFWKSWTQP